LADIESASRDSSEEMSEAAPENEALRIRRAAEAHLEAKGLRLT
jgi:hypothetical protein